MWVQQPRYLHGERAAARDHAPGGEILPGGAGNWKRIDAGMLPEPAVLILNEGVEVTRRHLFNRDRVAPDPLGVGKAPQRAAVFGHHHPRGRHFMQRQRPLFIRQHNRAAKQDHRPG